MNRRGELLTITLLAVCGATGCSASAALVKRSEARIDAREAMTVMAAKLRPAAPPALWATTLLSPEIDELVALPGDRYLVGTTNFDTTEYLTIAMFTPQYGPLLCLDGPTGAVRWSFARQSDAEAVYSVLGTSPSIVLSRLTKEARLLQGIDPDTGNKRWELTAGPAAPVLAVEESGILVLGAVDGKPASVYDLATGELRWQVPVEAGSRLVAVQGALLELGDWVRARDLLTGKLRWSSGYPGPGARLVFPAVLPDGVVVAGSRMVARLGNSGELRWSASIADVAGLRVADGLVVLQVPASDSSWRLVALDLERGTTRWERPLGAKPSSPLLAESGRLAYTTPKTLELLGLSDGKPVSSLPLPAAFSAARLPDHVLGVDDLVVVVGEGGAMAVQAADGGHRWSHSFRGVSDRLYVAAEIQLLAVAGALPAAGTPQTGGTRTPGSNATSSARRYAANAIEHQQWVFSSTRNDHGASARARRAGAIENSISAQQMAHHAEASAAQVQLSFAMLDASIAVGQMLANVVNAQMQRTKAARRRAALELAQQNHFRAVQDTFAVRPVRLRFGDGLLLIDLRTGAWAEIPVAPFEGSLAKDAFYDAQLATMSHGRLVTKGISLDPTKWEKLYVSVGMSSVRRSLLAWDLAGIHWSTADTYPARSVAKRSVDWRPPTPSVCDNGICNSPAQPQPGGRSGRAVTQCTKDVDCKGDRVCNDGICSSPTGPASSQPGGRSGRAAAQCTKDVDCKGDRVCNDGICGSPIERASSQPGGRGRRATVQCTKDVDCKGDQVCSDHVCASPMGPASAQPPVPAAAAR